MVAHRRSEQCRKNERRLASTGSGPVGALIGRVHGDMSRMNLEEIGESDAAMIVVGEATVDWAVEEQTRRAKKQVKKEVRAEAKEIEKAIDQA